MGRSRVLEDPFKDYQQVSFSRYFLYLPNKRFNKFCTDGFLVLGHDVDRYSASDTIPVRKTTASYRFLGPRGPFVLPSIGVPVRLQEFLLLLLLLLFLLLLFFLLLLLLSRHPCHPGVPHPRHPGCCCCCCYCCCWCCCCCCCK